MTKKAPKNGSTDDVGKLVGAGKHVAVDVVDFADPTRPKTCLEVDFPIIPVNQVAAIEGNASKPIYQMSKWWARRRSSVFRSILIAASTKAPADPALASKAVWDNYYANFQKKGSFSKLRVADIFMGGGTTLVEGSRLGMQMWGTDLSPVAWFVVKNEFTRATPDEVIALLSDIEGEVKPAIQPFYACDCPRGHKGEWSHADKQGGVTMSPLRADVADRAALRYEGPELIYVFWLKHGPCQVTGCHHRTPLMTTPVLAVKSLTVRCWEDQQCRHCQKRFDVEEHEARMAPGASFVIGDEVRPFAVLDRRTGVKCPHCKQQQLLPLDTKPSPRKVSLSLLVHPQFLAGAPGKTPDGATRGGRADDTAAATLEWNEARAAAARLIEVRGELPKTVTCPDTGIAIDTTTGPLGSQGVFTCGSCGRAQRLVEALEASGTTAPSTPAAVQGYCRKCDDDGQVYGGRFFAAVVDPAPFSAATTEWSKRSSGDLAGFWPESPIPFGHMTHQRQPLPQHGYTHYWKLFNHRQLLVHSQLLRAITSAGGGRHRSEVREFVLGAFQQYLRNQSMFTLWNIQADKLEPMFANNNYHPKALSVENSVFAPIGRGNWLSCTDSLIETAEWSANPWEIVSAERVRATAPALAKAISGKSVKVHPQDPLGAMPQLECVSATDLTPLADGSIDLVVTDPPFGGLLHYSELADFFYVWLRLPLRERYPALFSADYTPKTLEVVENRARQPDNPGAFYKRLLTECWRQAHRVLKPAGILAFTFHHSEDEPWVAVLESLFDAGFYLEATYPIRSDETKGDGEFGSKKIEYDIIHVCRKRIDEPTPVSWPRMRREVQEDVRRLQTLLEHHAKDGLAAADLQVIKRGKALEYFSRHYGKVMLDGERTLGVQGAIAGIIQLLEEESSKTEVPPLDAEPLTRQFLRIFDGRAEQPRDQMQKYLRGTGVSPDEFEARGWCKDEKKVYELVSPLVLAQDWVGKHRRNLETDYDQAMFLIGACFDESGINASDTLRNQNFKPHPALAALLEWHARRAHDSAVRNAASRAKAIFDAWARTNQDQAKQLALFGST